MAVVEEENEESVGIPDYAGVNLTLENPGSARTMCSEARPYLMSATPFENQELHNYSKYKWKKKTKMKETPSFSFKLNYSKFPNIFLFLYSQLSYFNICALAEALAKHNW